MADFGVTLTGDAELKAGVAAVAAGLESLDHAPQQTADMIAARAKALAPKRTGTLARSIVGKAVGGKATVGTPLDYGLPVHFGVPAHGQRAQPFLYDAIRYVEGDMIDAWITDIQQLIDKEITG